MKNQTKTRLRPTFGVMAHLALAAFLAGSLNGAPLQGGRLTAVPESGGNRLVIKVEDARPEVPVFFSAVCDHRISIGLDAIAGEIDVRLKVVQGRPEVMSLGLSGDGEVFSVSGGGLLSWAVRELTDGRRFLDLHPVPVPEGEAQPPLNLVVHTLIREPAVPGLAAILLITPGEAIGFASTIRVNPDDGLDIRVSSLSGLLPVTRTELRDRSIQLAGSGEAALHLQLALRGGIPAEAELQGAGLTGTVAADGHSVGFRLRGQFVVRKVGGARLPILGGGVGLTEIPAGRDWRVELRQGDAGLFYELVVDREGEFPIDLAFAVGVKEEGDWRKIGLWMPAAAVVPLELRGLKGEIEFDPNRSVVPAAADREWRGYLPAGGQATLAWKESRRAEKEALFFSSTELTDVRIGPGLLRQSSSFEIRILQGELARVSLELRGGGEILSVGGKDILGWKVVEADYGRRLEIQFSRPIAGRSELVIGSQEALGAFPVQVEGLRLVPAGTIRHSGMIRLANSGSVRIEVSESRGLLQLAPGQFAGGEPEKGLRQVFAYRFPSADYEYRMAAEQIQPEVGVSQVVTYEIGETDRIILADLELDIREAPLREWSVGIPADYAVVSVMGGPVEDYGLETVVSDGYRRLKVLFHTAVEGRQLVRLRLERNLPAAAEAWTLLPLRFFDAKSVRGHIGVLATPGYRLNPGSTDHLVEIPLSQFPRQSAALQQAWRIRDAAWSAVVGIEAMAQSVEADVFHLYTIKDGVAYASILINYFVVGAPASEWRIAVPRTVGNLDVVGQNVRRDWRRNGDEIIVTLHQPVLGAATLLLTFEESMSALGGRLSPGVVRPVGVQGERGYVQVVSPHQVKDEVRRMEGGLLKLEPLELPAEYRLLTNAPSLAVFQYTARPFELELDLEWYPQAETVEQVVDFADFVSVISRDGQVVTEGRFFVKTRGRKALRLLMPEDMQLWETRVDGAIVNARSDAAQILVPLPARLNPNDSVEVSMRFGQEQQGGDGSDVRLTAPQLFASTVIVEWTLRGDPDRILLPLGGNADLNGANPMIGGIRWMSGRAATRVGLLFALALSGGLLLRARSGWRVPVGTLVLGLACFAALILMAEAGLTGGRAASVLSYTSSVLPPGQPMTIHVANVEAGQMVYSRPGIALIAAGAVVILYAFRRAGRSRLVIALGGVLGSTGLLLQGSGAVLFFGLIALILALIALGRLVGWLRNRGRGTSSGPGSMPSTVVTSLVLGWMGWSAFGPVDLDARERPAIPPAELRAGATLERIDQDWWIVDGRLRAEATITARGVVGDSFVLLRSPAVLSSFSGDGLRVLKTEDEGMISYRVALEKAGQWTARLSYEMAVDVKAGRFVVPTGLAAVQRIRVDLDEGGWEMSSPSAVVATTEAAAAPDHSVAVLILSPGADAEIRLRSKQRDEDNVPAVIFAESAHLFLPGPGSVDLRSRILIRPSQGRVAEIRVKIPEGFTVGDVMDGPIGAWSFDPVGRLLRVSIEPRQADPFAFSIEAQMATPALPADLSLVPLRVEDTAGEVGMVALAFGDDARAEDVRTTGLSSISIDDFKLVAVPVNPEGGPPAAIQRVWRYGNEDGRVEFTAAAVEPEVRIGGRQVLSIDDDRMVLAGTLDLNIARVGLFRLSFELPEGLEVESLSGSALHQWTESEEAGHRIVTLHLRGRTLGEHSFAFSLSGPAPSAQASWSVPRLVVREATRQTGEILIVPGKGIRLRAVDRSDATPLDPRSIGGFQPGTLGFRLLQKNWFLGIGIEILDPWVTVQALQDVTVREGQTLTRIGLLFKVENAAVRQVRLILPGLSADERRTLRMSGSAVADFVAVAEVPDLWEIRFQRSIFGETDVQVEYQGVGSTGGGGIEVMTPAFPDSRTSGLYVAVRAGGRLELGVSRLPKGWQRIDWAAIPAGLQDRTNRSIPALAFRVTEADGGVTLQASRHEVADALRLRVTAAQLTTVFSVGGSFLTAVDLQLDVLEKGTLELRLPEGAQLFSVSVNGASTDPVLNDGTHLFHVFPKTGSDSSATVHFVYALNEPQSGRIELAGPSLSSPLENVTWRVVLPPGYELDDFEGGLRLLGGNETGGYGLEKYQAITSSARSAEMEEGVALLKQASSLLQSGRQQEAGEILQRASSAQGLDEASNEDARVQLRALKTQQAVLGLNTRRQKLYLDNRTDAARNEQLEQAATVNPFMQGRLNFDPNQVDQLLMGNTAEENAALRGIAAKLVEQQLAAEPTAVAIDVTMPERGRVLVFNRSLQFDGSAPLSLGLDIERTDRTGFLAIAAVLIGIGILAFVLVPERKEKRIG
ncbi:MAG: hypothetical protein R3F07_13075 [Opitutaceae bacterium]